MAQRHAQAGEIVDLRPFGKDFPSQQTTAIVKTKSFEAIRLVIPAGRDIPAHEVAGGIILHCLEGRVSLRIADADRQLSAGDWIYLDGGASHRLKAIEDASLLLTILFER